MDIGFGSRVFSDERQDRILSLVRQAGAASIDDLAMQFNVTPQTIRLRKRNLDHEERKREDRAVKSAE